MPLEHSSSPAAFRRNIASLYGEIGKSPHIASRQQAQAIAFETQRRAAAGKATGGVVGYDMGGGVDPVSAVINALGAVSQQGSASGSQQGGGLAASMRSMNPAAPSNPQVAAASAPAMVANRSPAMNVLPQGVIAPANPIVARPMMNSGGVASFADGGFSMQRSPHLGATWEERGEARNMMHTGPIMSAVPGRTDSHHMVVPSGAYVLPAAHVSAMGQGNSVAGLNAAHAMFGPGGPYGVGAMRMGHGSLPRPPRPMTNFARGGGYSEGGARGHDGQHIPVECMLSGGEYVVGPNVVRAIGKGSLKNGHKILDAYVMHSRKKEIETLKRLPEPAKK